MTVQAEATPARAGSAPAETGAFAQQVMTDCIGGLICLLAALGDRHGLFRALAGSGPVTPAEFAGTAGVDPRYGQEWLSAMAAAGYLAHDPASGRFSLPDAHVPVLALDDTPASLGGPLQWMLGVAPALDAISDAIRDGGGVTADRYGPELWPAMERLGAPMYGGALVPEWLPRMPRVRGLLEGGAAVADIGAGSGRALIALAQAYARGSYTGFDIQPAQVERARANAGRAGLADRVRFEVRDAAAGLPGRYDVVLLFDVVHDAADPVGLLRAARDAVRPGGAAVVLELASGGSLQANTHPVGALYYGVSLLYCLPASLAAGGPGLGSLGLPEERLAGFAAQAGFSGVRRVLDHPPAHTLYELLP